ncbi:MAG: hypothetical protein Alis3KO_23550 [Aliiglaciecola sp.]
MMLNYKHYVDDIRATITEVSVADLVTRLQDFNLVIDIREPQELAEGVIAGSIAIPRGLLEASIGEHIKDCDDAEASALPILLYCRSGARSALAARTLREMGFNNVYSLAGGINAWREADLPLETSK